VIRPSPLAIAAAALFALAAAAPAAASDNANGTLTVETEARPARVEVAHAYLVSGPDSFDPKKMTRRIVFTRADERAAIEACDDVGCATLSLGDGMTFDVGEAGMASWWGHVRPMQYSGMSGSALKLSADTAERMAGTFTVDTTGVKASIVFDATLVKAFAK
jgi:hypothetical protein